MYLFKLVVLSFLLRGNTLKNCELELANQKCEGDQDLFSSYGRKLQQAFFRGKHALSIRTIGYAYNTSTTSTYLI